MTQFVQVRQTAWHSTCWRPEKPIVWTSDISILPHCSLGDRDINLLSLAIALLGSRNIQCSSDVKFYCPWKQTSPPSWPVKQYLLQWTSAYLKATHPKPKAVPEVQINSIHKTTAVIFQLAEWLHRSEDTVAPKWFLICTILVLFILSTWCKTCQKPSLQLLTGRLEIIHDGFHHFSIGRSSI